MPANCCLVIEDTSKVGRGGGQIISELVSKALANADRQVTLLDLGNRQTAWRLQGEPRISYLGGHALSLFRHAKGLKPNLIYCGTKKSLLLGLAIKCLHPKCRLYFHVHNLSSRQFVDVATALAADMFCEMTLFPTEFTRQHFSPWRHARQRVIGNPANRPRDSQPSRQNDAPVRIGFVGRLTRDKGFHLYLGLVERLSGPHSRFVVVTQEAPPQELTAKWSQIEWHVGVERAAVHQHYDVLMMLSTVPETYSLSAAEAALAGKLILANDSGAVGEVLASYPGLIALHDVSDAEKQLRRVLEGAYPLHQTALPHGGLVLDEHQFANLAVDLLTAR